MRLYDDPPIPIRARATRQPNLEMDARSANRAAGGEALAPSTDRPAPAAAASCPACGKPIGSNARHCTACLSAACKREIDKYGVPLQLGRIVDITDVGIVDQACVPRWPNDGEHPGPLVPTPQERVDGAMRGAADDIDAGLVGAGGALFTAIACALAVVLILSAIFSR